MFPIQKTLVRCKIWHFFSDPLMMVIWWEDGWTAYLHTTGHVFSAHEVLKLVAPTNWGLCLPNLITILHNFRQWELYYQYLWCQRKPIPIKPKAATLWLLPPEGAWDRLCVLLTGVGVRRWRSGNNLQPDQSHLANSSCSWPLSAWSLCYLKAEKEGGPLFLCSQVSSLVCFLYPLIVSSDPKEDIHIFMYNGARHKLGRWKF